MPTSANSTQGESTTATSSYNSSTSTSSVVTSDSGLPPANLSTPPIPIPTFTEPSTTATSAQAPAASLIAGSAVGIALGVFAGASVLVAAALFLFLRERKRQRHRDSITRKLRPESEGAPSRVLSSTWSWFGSLAMGLEPDPYPKHTYAYETRQSWVPRGLDEPTRADPTTLTFGEHGVRDPFADPRLLGSENSRTPRMSMASSGETGSSARGSSER